jgi:uncharacterized protein (TIGR02145 family)
LSEDKPETNFLEVTFNLYLYSYINVGYYCHGFQPRKYLGLMKSIFFSNIFILAASSLPVIYGCKEKEIPVPLPVLTTTEVDYVSAFKAVTGGVVVNIGEVQIDSWGICYGIIDNPLYWEREIFAEINRLGRYTCTLNGLRSNTTYYVRAFAKTGADISYGDQLSFTTTSGLDDQKVFNPSLVYGSVTDAAGNAYKTIQIGTQTWMAENLSTTKYNDGIYIPFINDDLEWVKLSTPGYCYYRDDELSYKKNFGALYNWFAVNTGKLCPTGWHVPSQEDWATLSTHLGGEASAYTKLKESGTTHWIAPNYGTNESGFTSLPGGYRYGFYSAGHSTGYFNYLGTDGYWWTSKEYSATEARYLHMFESRFVSFGSNYKPYGHSVRCVMN